MNEEDLRKAGVSTHTGFPNAAIGSASKQLDLTRLLIRHPSATYFMRLESNEWHALGVWAGDIVIIDRARVAADNDIVAWWDGESFTMSAKRAVPIDITVWGTVTSVIHPFGYT